VKLTSVAAVIDSREVVRLRLAVDTGSIRELLAVVVTEPTLSLVASRRKSSGKVTRFAVCYETPPTCWFLASFEAAELP
jgi:hypothetical protein